MPAVLIGGVTLDHSYVSIDEIESKHRARLVSDKAFRRSVEQYLGDVLIAGLGKATWEFSELTETAGEQIVHVPNSSPYQPQLALAQFLAHAAKRTGGPGVLRDQTVRWDRKDREAELARLLALPITPIDLDDPPSTAGLDAAAYRAAILPIARAIGALYVEVKPNAAWMVGDSNGDSIGKLLMPGWPIFDTVRSGLAKGDLAAQVADRNLSTSLRHQVASV